MTTPGEEDWQRLAEQLIARRVAIAGPNRAEWIRGQYMNQGMVRTIEDIENARRTNYGASTLAWVEQTYRWGTGSVKAVLQGGEPTLIDEPVGPQGQDAYVAEQGDKTDEDSPLEKILRAVLQNTEAIVAMEQRLDQRVSAIERRLDDDRSRPVGVAGDDA